MGTPISFHCTRSQLEGAARQHLGIKNPFLGDDSNCPEAVDIIKHLVFKFGLNRINEHVIRCDQAPPESARDRSLVKISIYVQPHWDGPEFLPQVAKLQEMLLDRAG